MKGFKYQAKCGSDYYTDIVEVGVYNGRKVYSATVLHGHSGKSRAYGKYISATWLLEKVKNLLLEPEHFVNGIKRVKEIIDYTNDS